MLRFFFFFKNYVSSLNLVLIIYGSGWQGWYRTYTSKDCQTFSCSVDT